MKWKLIHLTVLTKKDKDDKEGGALSELEKYVMCKFV